MKATTAEHFDRQYQTHLKHLKLKGLQPKTIDAYARAIRRLGGYFSHRIDDLTEAQLTGYFSDLIETHSWSAVKLDLYGLKFYTTHVLQLFPISPVPRGAEAKVLDKRIEIPVALSRVSPLSMRRVAISVSMVSRRPQVPVARLPEPKQSAKAEFHRFPRGVARSVSFMSLSTRPCPPWPRFYCASFAIVSRRFTGASKRKLFPIFCFPSSPSSCNPSKSARAVW